MMKKRLVFAVVVSIFWWVNLVCGAMLADVELPIITNYKNIIKITDNSYDDSSPQINIRKNIVWQARILYGNGQAQDDIFAYNSSNSIIRITNDANLDGPPQINTDGNIVWSRRNRTSTNDIYFYNLSQGIFKQISNTEINDFNPQINSRGDIVWIGNRLIGYNLFAGEVFYYDFISNTPKQLTTDSYSDSSPLINDNGEVVWSKYYGGNPSTDEIFFYDGSTKKITNKYNYRKVGHQINNHGNIVWQEHDGTDYEIFFYNTTTKIIKQITNDFYTNSSPQINDKGDIVWQGYDGNDYEIYLYNIATGITKQITDNSYDDKGPKINTIGTISWQGYDGTDYEIYVYINSLDSVIQLTNNSYDDIQPQINENGDIVWQGYDGTDYEIYLASTGLEIIDPNPDLLNNNGLIIYNDIDKLVKANAIRTGAVTDGVTELLLRIETQDDVTFSIKSGSFDDGSLSQINTSGYNTSITVSPQTTPDGRSFAFVRYRSPSRFSSTISNVSSRNITINAEILSYASYSNIQKDIVLERPPVLLIHGLWSAPDTWTDGFLNTLETRGFGAKNNGVFIVNYKKFNSNGFDPSKSLKNNKPIEMFINTINDAKFYMREKNIAITQIDVIGHSMGGLVARARTKIKDNNYFRKDNYFQGDIHRLVTVGTPNLGSGLANYLLNSGCFGNIFNFIGNRIDKGAVADLSIGSDALNIVNTGGSYIPIHTIVGIADNDQEAAFESGLHTLMLLAAKGFEPFSAAIKQCQESVFNGNIFPGLRSETIFGDQNSDLIVPVTSQVGRNFYLTNTVSSFVNPLVHSSSFNYIGIPEVESYDIQNELIKILNSPDESYCFINKNNC